MTIVYVILTGIVAYLGGLGTAFLIYRYIFKKKMKQMLTSLPISNISNLGDAKKMLGDMMGGKSISDTLSGMLKDAKDGSTDKKD